MNKLYFFKTFALTLALITGQSYADLNSNSADASSAPGGEAGVNGNTQNTSSGNEGDADITGNTDLSSNTNSDGSNSNVSGNTQSDSSSSDSGSNVAGNTENTSSGNEGDANISGNTENNANSESSGDNVAGNTSNNTSSGNEGDSNITGDTQSDASSDTAGNNISGNTQSDASTNNEGDSNITGNSQSGTGLADITGGIQGGSGTTVTQGDAGTRLLGDVGVPVETYSSRDTDFSLVIHMSCFGQNLRSARNGLHPGGTVTANICMQNSRATDNQDFQSYQFNVSSSAVIGGTTHSSPNGIFTYTSTFNNGELIDDTIFRIVGGWTRPDGSRCSTQFVQSGALSHNGIGQSGSSGNMIVANVAFPGGREGVCGSFVSPLVLLFDEDVPEFTSVVEFPLHKNTKYTYWPEAQSKAEILAYDRNGNGIIDNSNELFTNNQHDNAFEQLKELDKDTQGKQDSQISAKDKSYAKLILWNDINSDGISQKSEMRSLKQAGVQSIDLEYQLEGIRDIGGRAQWREDSSFSFKAKNGKLQEGKIIDFWFHPYFGENVITKAGN